MSLMQHWALMGGAIAAVTAAVAWIADMRRERRPHLDQVGFMPWTGVFFLALFLAVLLLGLGAKAWLAQ